MSFMPMNWEQRPAIQEKQAGGGGLLGSIFGGLGSLFGGGPKSGGGVGSAIGGALGGLLGPVGGLLGGALGGIFGGGGGDSGKAFSKEPAYTPWGGGNVGAKDQPASPDWFGKFGEWGGGFGWGDKLGGGGKMGPGPDPVYTKGGGLDDWGGKLGDYAPEQPMGPWGPGSERYDDPNIQYIASDARLKTDIRPIGGALARIGKL